MKPLHSILTALFLLAATSILQAEDTLRWELRVDGLACPYCAYGVEKKLKAIDGVRQVSVDLEKGIVHVEALPQTEITASRMETLMRDAGFTFRSMKQLP